MASISSCGLLSPLLVVLCFSSVAAQLSSSFYDTSCPNALSIIKSGVTDALSSDKRMGASLIRLHFHDCFVNGCDASVLLDDTSSLTGEKSALPNENSLRGFDVVDTIKSNLESACPQTVSCADILAVAARDSVVELGGPSWTVVLGRRDSTTASKTAAENDLPSPFLDLSGLTSAFSNKGLSTTDLVALSGAHTLGQAKCIAFRNRIYNEANIDASYAASKQANCPRSGGDGNLAPLDDSTPNAFDNLYFSNLDSRKGLLHSDQVLFNNGSTDSLVQSYSSSQSTFFSDFISAMVKMGNLDPLTGSSGQIRIDCKKVN